MTWSKWDMVFFSVLLMVILHTCEIEAGLSDPGRLQFASTSKNNSAEPRALNSSLSYNDPTFHLKQFWENDENIVIREKRRTQKEKAEKEKMTKPSKKLRKMITEFRKRHQRTKKTHLWKAFRREILGSKRLSRPDKKAARRIGQRTVKRKIKSRKPYKKQSPQKQLPPNESNSNGNNFNDTGDELSAVSYSISSVPTAAASDYGNSPSFDQPTQTYQNTYDSSHWDKARKNVDDIFDRHRERMADINKKYRERVEDIRKNGEKWRETFRERQADINKRYREHMADIDKKYRERMEDIRKNRAKWDEDRRKTSFSFVQGPKSHPWLRCHQTAGLVTANLDDVKQVIMDMET
ncbi:hypothetical protein DdX_22301 [Ditylenchus destructor]|uniref:Uncharacterized protein n=1 Tax=Ditylenchus destructor TaxID=166010 RepID=A0AAD4MEF5_9BILA|nr:hypothetical protein DdX_22301 [Ditylenchus destructor]